MAGWLDAASRVFGGGRAEEPDDPRYTIPCACGRSVTGMRQAEWQRTQCPGCGEVLFVLPANVYPRPKLRKPAVPKPAVQPPERVVPPPQADESVDTEEIEEIPREMPIRAASARAQRRVGQASSRTDQPPVRPGRRVVTPVRLLLASIVTLVALTGWWMVRAQKREQADVIIRTRVPALEQLVSDRQLPGLQAELEAICRAQETLGLDDPPARGRRQLLREVTALNSLMPLSLFELVRDAEQHLTNSDAEWARHYGTFRGRWIILDVPVYQTTDPAGEDVIAVDVPLVAGPRPFRIFADLKTFDLLSLSEEPRPLMFAAQLDSCMLSTEDVPIVVLRLNPDTGFLWCGDETWDIAGLGEDNAEQVAALKKRLREQRVLVGVEP